jgi:acetolactate synthase-1/2/3 large subunit
MAQGMGVPARRVARAEDFSAALKNAFEMHGPTLIEAIVPSEYEGLKLKALPHMLNALGSVPSPVAKAIKKKIAP